MANATPDRGLVWLPLYRAQQVWGLEGRGWLDPAGIAAVVKRLVASTKPLKGLPAKAADTATSTDGMYHIDVARDERPEEGYRQGVVDTRADGGDEALWEDYLDHFMVGRGRPGDEGEDPKAPGWQASCANECRRMIACAAANAEYHRYSVCLLGQ